MKFQYEELQQFAQIKMEYSLLTYVRSRSCAGRELILTRNINNVAISISKGVHSRDQDPWGAARSAVCADHLFASARDEVAVVRQTDWGGCDAEKTCTREIFLQGVKF